MTSVIPKIEALLFLAGDAVSKRELARIVAVSEEELGEALAELQALLVGRGLSLLVTPTHAQLATSGSVAEFVKQYLAEETKKLSAAAAETLAIIAYRGPVSLGEVDALRGVDSRRVVSHLQQRALVRTVDGRVPARYVITEEFLRQLGVTKPDELPHFEDLSQDDRIEKIINQEK